jgi:exodeoxyribonuclease VII small subunit
MSKNMTFEEAIGRLNEIVGLLENGNEPLEQSLKLFEEGSALASFCYKKLETAEQKIKRLDELEGKDKNPNE